MEYRRNERQKRLNNEKTKTSHRRKSILRIVEELNIKKIKPKVPLDLRNDKSINYTYETLRKQWSELRLKQRIKNRKKWKRQSNRINKARYKKDPIFKQKMLLRNKIKYEKRKKIENNLIQTIKLLSKKLMEARNEVKINNKIKGSKAS